MEDNQINLDDLDLDQIQDNADKTLKAKNRIHALAITAQESSKAKEAAEAAQKAAEEARALAEKERDFFKDFSKITSQHPAAAELQDKIFEKVRGGYTTEDATYAVLAKEGKLGGAQQAIGEQTQARMQDVVGGDATLTNIEGADKPLEQMTTEEKYSALREADQRGELHVLLTGRPRD